ncbi:hypothetical protein CYLTODRAFT_428091 [Cylindrobasidium torrendii FP15055 ss-10]|uniref:Mitochondrial import inner membrane translocase subunit TIM54 n=1 Tax=Cylindrobasidium torrendii FP15055 ss-10 TaxID=1314674 RepID=A0A0D7BUX7_9AGAR|nr:hypothetical protein CYLTODRAFT_428091 [Cylindrobasidium torrendii FP15055 ss-10]
MTGISWMRKYAKLPSRNMSIFLGATSLVIGSYVYDRRECRRIREEYVDKVKHISEEIVDHHSYPRKVTVYGAKWPGDEDYDQCIKFFKKYVKPVFVAAAIDYSIHVGKKHGDISNLVAEDIKKRRRQELGIQAADSLGLQMPAAYSPRSKEALRKEELDGGIVIVGRPTWKEFMDGLKRGWSEPPVSVDYDEQLAHQLAEDGAFDEIPADSAPRPYTAIRELLTPSPVDSQMPAVIPQLPPILFVNFTDYIGLKLIPQMMYDFFNRRYLVQMGAESAYRLVMSQTRPFQSPPASVNNATEADGHVSSDLDFGRAAEGYYKKSLNDLEAEIEKARTKYYEELPKKIATAFELASGDREPTKDEISYPSPTEVQLREERMKKEKRWRSTIMGWDIVRPSAEVAWDKRFEGKLTVFVDPEATKAD